MKKLSLILSFMLLSLALYSQTGIGTKTTDPSAMLEVKSPNKGFLPSRIQLTGLTDNVTVPAPATGLVVFHTGTSTMAAGLYANIGNPTSALWSSGSQPVNEVEGSKIYKVKYLGRNLESAGFPKPTLTIKELNLEVRFAHFTDGSGNLQIRLVAVPPQTVNVRIASHWSGTNVAVTPHAALHGSDTYTKTFTTANFNTWQSVNTGTAWLAYNYYMTTDEPAYINEPCILRSLTSYGNQGTNTTQEQYFWVAEVF